MNRVTCAARQRLLPRVLGILLALAGCADDAPNANPPQLYNLAHAPARIQQAAKAVVRIQHPAGASGTGSFISRDGLLLTNNHVLGTDECALEGCQIALTFDHQRGRPSSEPRDVFAVPQHVDVGLDMAVLQVYEDDSAREPLATPDFLRLEPRDAKDLIGSRVTAVGHPLGRLKKWSSGFVIDAQGQWFESSVFSLPGSSGSPMLDDAGRIVGLLHRGADGFDLLTRTSSQVSTLATAASALDTALSVHLPDTMISLAAPLSAAEVVARSDAFLAGGALSATVMGKTTSVVALLGAACDAALMREDYTSLEQLSGALAPCYASLDFIECRSDLEDEPAVPTACPEDEREAWIARLRSVSRRQSDFNGALELSPISFGMESLAQSEAEGERLGREAILEVLDETKPAYDFALAPYLAAYNIASYDGQSTRELIANYRRFPFYERSGWEIALSALWLYSNDELTRTQALGILKRLYHDDKLSLGAKLRIEEVLYNSGVLL